MIKSDFDLAFDWILKAEGGYVNNSNDPGGETNYGISKRAYPKLDIANLTKEKAKEIYRTDYWKKAGCDLRTWPENICIFDTAVNQGVTKATNINFVDWKDFLFKRLRIYGNLAKKNPKLAGFLRGWINRILDLYDFITITKEV